MTFSKLRLAALNLFLGVFVALLVLDTLPCTPAAMRQGLQPLLVRLSIDQGPFALFSPHPDSINTRLVAEITYRDGARATWTSPDWRSLPLAERFLGYRHQEWLDHMAARPEPALEPWCRHLARSLRPALPDADRGAAVRLIAEEGRVPPAAELPWKSWRALPEFQDSVVLSLEYLR